MKTTQAALGLIACVMAGSAFAQTNVTIGGLVDTFAGSVKNSGDPGRKGVVGSGGMTTSWFGFKGTEDLGGGLRAEFALTGFFRGDTGESGRFGGDNLFSRDANIGLAGGFGKVQLGRGLAPNFLPTVLFNPFGDSFTFSPLVVHLNVPSGAFAARTWTAANAGDTGWSNQIIYTTPKFGGLSANVHYQFGEVAGATGRNNVGVNLLYFNGPFAATAFYHDVQSANPNPGAIIDVTASPVSFASINKQKAYFVGASYDFKVVKLFGTYQRNKDDTTTAAELTDKVASLGLSAPVGPGSVLLGYAHTDRTGSLVGADRKRDTVSVGYDYVMSKRTDLYAIAMTDKITGASRAQSFGVGVRHKF
ncbi:porin [Noviherbaspirillum sp. Root189]|uniref:porin n=1 Tax=Noviherbaspirillum sp. Root189 TaxID=1736487 RepID=UPI0007095F64|nr:porin [Noviherbaspirillum sp. Root189]KRB94260.1 porin [Noviherbaspirillum sp. Root189]